jgi:DNA-binding IclR family transcriptional regulator
MKKRVPSGSATRAAKAGPAPETNARYKVEAVSRAVLLLDALRRTPGPIAIEDLAERAGLQRSAALATIATLERRGLLQRSVRGAESVSLGLGWLRLADVKRQQIALREVALPLMRRVRDAVNETVSLGIRIGQSRVNIEYAECQHEVRRIVQPGFHVALHVGAGGRALMSGLDDTEIEAYLANVHTSQVEKSRLLAAIKAARRDGYAVVEGEVASDIGAIASPVRNHAGDVVATITISMPEDRLTPQMRARCTREVMKAAREISLALGYDPARAA